MNNKIIEDFDIVIGDTSDIVIAFSEENQISQSSSLLNFNIIGTSIVIRDYEFDFYMSNIDQCVLERIKNRGSFLLSQVNDLGPVHIWLCASNNAEGDNGYQ